MRLQTADAFERIRDLVERAPELKAAWCTRFESDAGPTIPALMLLLPLYCDDPADEFFRDRISLVCRMVFTTDYAFEFIVKNLDVSQLRRFANVRSGKKWPKRDPLVKALAGFGIIRVWSKGQWRKLKAPSSGN